MIDRPLTWRERVSLILATLRGRTVTSDAEPIGFRVTPRAPSTAPGRPILIARDRPILIAPNERMGDFLRRSLGFDRSEMVVLSAANPDHLSALRGRRDCTIFLNEPEHWPDGVFEDIMPHLYGCSVFFLRGAEHASPARHQDPRTDD